jgi:Protein of unknown function (DUF4238)
MSISEPTRHHYIPIFYLKQWTGADGRLCEYSRPFDKVKAKRKHPAATAYVAGLYTVKDLPPERTQFVEKEFMQRVDSGAAEALIDLLKVTPQPMDKEPDWIRVICWARFVYSLGVRNPEWIGVIQQSLDSGSFSVAVSIEDTDLRAIEKNSNIRVQKLVAPAQFLLPNLINSESAIRAITFFF